MKNPVSTKGNAAEQARTQALEKWLTSNPAYSTSEAHKAAFLAGYEAAAGPLPATMDAFIEAKADELRGLAEIEKRRLANLPAGTCPECEGSGDLDSALHSTPCQACNGTGRLA